MGMIHKKSRTTGKRPRRTGEKVAPNTGTELLALGLGVVLSLPSLDFFPLFLALVLTQARAPKGPHSRKPRKVLAVIFWQGFSWTERSSLQFLQGITPKSAEGRKLSDKKKAHKL